VQVEARRRCCILVEGSPGYGKTTLARKFATDWGEKADYLVHFRLLVFIYCRDLRGRPLADYVAETFPLLPVPGKGEVPVDLNNWPNRQEGILLLTVILFSFHFPFSPSGRRSSLCWTGWTSAARQTRPR
jgi:hypothetical protein